MKKFAISLLTVCLLMAFSPFATSASTIAPKAVAAETPAAPPSTQALNDRLVAIKTMDKSNLSGSERKALRQEKREIKRTINKSAGISNGGIYLSAGAVILIVILIIVLL